MASDSSGSLSPAVPPLRGGWQDPSLGGGPPDLSLPLPARFDVGPLPLTGTPSLRPGKRQKAAVRQCAASPAGRGLFPRPCLPTLVPALFFRPWYRPGGQGPGDSSSSSSSSSSLQVCPLPTYLGMPWVLFLSGYPHHSHYPGVLFPYTKSSFPSQQHPVLGTSGRQRLSGSGHSNTVDTQGGQPAST